MGYNSLSQEYIYCETNMINNPSQHSFSLFERLIFGLSSDYSKIGSLRQLSDYF